MFVAIVNVTVPAVDLLQTAVATCSIKYSLPNLSYQSLIYEWQKDGEVIHTGASNQYQFSSTKFSDAGNLYDCIVRERGAIIGRNTFEFYVIG